MRFPLLTRLPLALGLLLTAPMPAAWGRTAPIVVRPALKTVQTIQGPISELTLANGLKVILKENRAAPVVSWVVLYKVGSRNESLGATGSAHLLEHMLFKGTKTLGKGQIAQLLDRNGASSNAGTWIDWTQYYETYASDRLELGLVVEAARMRDALILDSERQSEMTVVRNEMERGESNPGRMLYQSLMSTAFKAHPYHHPTIGWRSDVEGVSTARLRAFYNTYYQPNNAVAVLVGDFKTADAVKLIQKHFDAIPRGPKPPEVYTREEPQTGERRVTLRRRGETNLVQLGFHIPDAKSPDLGPLLVLDSVLSSGVTSRLYQAIVEKELATQAWSDVGVTRDPGLFRLGATLKPGADHAKVEAALVSEVERLKQDGVSADELDKAKKQAEAGYIYQNEGVSGLAQSLASYEAIATWQRSFSLLQEIQKVTASDLVRVAKAYLVTDNRTAAWYVATPDGPVPPTPVNLGGGTATENKGRVKPAPVFAFERSKAKPRALTAPKPFTLPNGLTLVVLENATSQTVALDGYLRAGDMHDPAGKQGTAAAVAALLDAGTTRRSKLALASDLERVAASLGYSSGTATTDISGHWIAQDTERALDALAETLMAPIFPQEELDKLKARWVAAIQQGEDVPGNRASRALAQAIYPVGHPFYEHDATRQIDELKAITRQDLVDFHKRHYGPNATTLVVVGRAHAMVIRDGLARRFAGWGPVATAPAEIPTVAKTQPRRIALSMPDKTNVEIRLGHAGSIRRSDPGYYAAALANHVLGGDTLTGRLGLKLRDELGLTYGVSSSFGAGLGAGAWRTQITVHPRSVETALSALRGELARFVATGLTQSELGYAKGAFIGSQAVGLASNGGMASSLSAITLYGLGLDYWARYPGIINGVSLEAANAAARRLVDPARGHVVLVGPVMPGRPAGAAQ